MKILYAAFVRLPTEKAHGAQIMSTCEALSKQGADISLYIPGRRTHIHQDPFAYYGIEKNFSIQKVFGIDLVWLGKIGFIFSALIFSEALRWTKDFKTADYVYSRDAFVLLQYTLLRKKYVYEGHTKPTPVSIFVAKRAHKVVVISEGLKEAYEKEGVPNEKIVVAHDAIDPTLFKQVYSQEASRKKFGIPEKKRVALYVGKIDSQKGADTFAAASEYLTEDVLCVLIGPGKDAQALKKRYTKALFLKETPYRKIAEVLTAADVLVLPNSGTDKDAAVYTSPLKAFAYLASGKPIVASDVPALKAVLGGEATYFTPDNAKDCAHKIEEVLKAEMPYIDRDCYTWDMRAKTIYKALAYA